MRTDLQDEEGMATHEQGDFRSTHPPTCRECGRQSCCVRCLQMPLPAPPIQKEHEQATRMVEGQPRRIDPAGSTATGNELSVSVSEERERCARIVEAMATGPWGAEHDAITPRHLAEQIARAIRNPPSPRQP